MNLNKKKFSVQNATWHSAFCHVWKMLHSPCLNIVKSQNKTILKRTCFAFWDAFNHKTQKEFENWNHHDVTVCDPFNKSCTELRELKYRIILSMKTIGPHGATCVVRLKSSLFLKRKLGLFVGNSYTICMLWTSCVSTLL